MWRTVALSASHLGSARGGKIQQNPEKVNKEFIRFSTKLPALEAIPISRQGGQNPFPLFSMKTVERGGKRKGEKRIRRRL